MFKKILRLATVVLFIAVALPASSSTIVSETAKPNPTEKIVDPKVQVLLNRLEQIKSMDRSTMTRVERKELRNEVKDIRKEMKAVNNGVYLSVGAIIIIILLLILIL
jgi:hypothetical protein